MNKKQKRNLMRIIVAAILMIVLHFAPVSDGTVRALPGSLLDYRV
ncbi:MAG: hypothetical protein ACLVHE_07395 [Dialister invisus]